MDRQKAVALAALRLSEHLMRSHKRSIVDPLIASTALVLANRFRAQHRALRKVLPDIAAMMPDARIHSALPSAARLAIVNAFNDFSYPMFDSHVAAAGSTAFAGGFGIAADQVDLSGDAPEYSPGPISDGIDNTTQTSVLDAATEVFAVAGTFAALSSAIDAVFTDAVDNRAEMIASTEIASAFNSGASAAAKAASDQGADVEKLWDAEPDACDDCSANADQGWIDDSDSFDSGDDEPPELIPGAYRGVLSYRPLEFLKRTDAGLKGK